MSSYAQLFPSCSQTFLQVMKLKISYTVKFVSTDYLSLLTLLTTGASSKHLILFPQQLPTVTPLQDSVHTFGRVILQGSRLLATHEAFSDACIPFGVTSQMELILRSHASSLSIASELRMAHS